MARLRAAAAARGRRHIAWLCGETVADLHCQPAAAWAPMLVVGREHYVESVQLYPGIPARELRKVLSQEIAAEPGVVAVPGPPGEERTTVRFFRLKPAALAAAAPYLWIVPETLALSAAVEGSFLQVERAGFRYYLAPDGTSQPEGGILRDARLQAMAMGVPPEPPRVLDDQVALGSLMWAGLWRLSPGHWTLLGNRGRQARWSAAVRWRPLAALAVGGLILYMTLASLYLGASLSAREQALEALGDDVSELLALRESLTDGAARLAALVALENTRQPSYPAWAMVAAIWEAGGTVAALQASDGRIAIRGTVVNAADVIDTLSQLPEVAGLRMDAPVRRTRTGESFAVVAELVEATSEDSGPAGRAGR